MDLILWLGVFVMVGIVRPTASTDKLVKYRDNLRKVNRWKCSEPKAQLVYIEDEYDDFNVESLYVPNAAVVRRCGRSIGCCRQPGQECVAAETEDVVFSFRETRFDDSTEEKKRMVKIKLKNDTKCRCRWPSDSRRNA